MCIRVGWRQRLTLTEHFRFSPDSPVLRKQLSYGVFVHFSLSLRERCAHKTLCYSCLLSEIGAQFRVYESETSYGIIAIIKHICGTRTIEMVCNNLNLHHKIIFNNYFCTSLNIDVLI